MEKCREEIDKAVKKAVKQKKIRRGVKKCNIHFHMGFSKAQSLEALNCFLHSWGSVWSCGFCFLLYLTVDIEAAFVLEEEAKATC